MDYLYTKFYAIRQIRKATEMRLTRCSRLLLLLITVEFVDHSNELVVIVSAEQ